MMVGMVISTRRMMIKVIFQSDRNVKSNILCNLIKVWNPQTFYISQYFQDNELSIFFIVNATCQVRNNLLY